MAAVTTVIKPDFYPHCETEIRVESWEGRGGSRRGNTVPLIVSTGAVRLQTYATRDELRALGEMLLRHADEGEVLEVAA